jgi:hypothetical protein
MSLLRVAVGVLIGGGLLVGLLALAMRFPLAAAVVVLWFFGTGLLYLVIVGLQRGAISARRSHYERRTSPFSFWFYIVFYLLLGALAFGFGVYCMTNPQSLRWN